MSYCSMTDIAQTDSFFHSPGIGVEATVQRDERIFTHIYTYLYHCAVVGVNLEGCFRDPHCSQKEWTRSWTLQVRLG